MTHNIIFQELATGLQVIVTDKESTDSNDVRSMAQLSAIRHNLILISITQIFDV